jgi:hypothetical protein
MHEEVHVRVFGQVGERVAHAEDRRRLLIEMSAEREHVVDRARDG